MSGEDLPAGFENLVVPGRMTDVDLAFAERAALRRSSLPVHWLEPELVEQGTFQGAVGGRFPFEALTTQARESGETTWVVCGAAGLGKSTLLRALELSLLEARAPVIYLNAALLRLHTITNEVDAADLVRESRPPGFPAKFWKACAKRREVVVLLDAVNEVERKFPAGPTWRLVGKLLGGNHGFTVIATSRDPDEDAGEMRLVRRLKLQDFTSAQSHRYLAASGLDSHDCIQWLDAIGLTGASSNPLLLRSLVTLMAEPTTQPDKRLASRAELLRAAALAQVERAAYPPTQLAS